jgi:hypothetical protein
MRVYAAEDIQKNALVYQVSVKIQFLKNNNDPKIKRWDKGSDAPKKKDSTALQKCAKRTKKKQPKRCVRNLKNQKIEFRSDALINVFNALQVCRKIL